MADADTDQKTEQPTAKRVADAMQRGEVVSSTEVNHWFMLAAAALLIAVFADDIAASLRVSLAGYLARAHETTLDAEGVQALLSGILLDLLRLFTASLAILVVAAIAAALVQHPFIISWEKLKPKLSSLDIVKGVKQKASLKTAVEFLKDLAKLAVVGSAIVVLIWSERGAIAEAMRRDLVDLLPYVERLTLKLLLVTLIIMGGVALGDYAFQRFDYYKKLRMTKQEVKDERKQTEGNPEVKRKLHSIRVQRLRQRMMAAVPDADVVITNPSHFAVALRYDAEAMAAPVVIAKGQDLIAHRIRALAKEHEVPIVENPPLARTLYRAVDVGQEIPVTHYRAVAEVIGYVMRLNRGRRPARRSV